MFEKGELVEVDISFGLIGQPRWTLGVYIREDVVEGSFSCPSVYVYVQLFEALEPFWHSEVRKLK